MKYFSMFSGIGGFELGIQRAYNNKLQSEKSEQTDSESRRKRIINEQQGSVLFTDNASLCIGYSEIDKYATQTYNKHFGGHKNYGDATKIIAEELPDFDMLCGGFPCQAFSIAGKRKGFRDTRGTLFFDIARILEVKKPKLVLLENVKGLLNHSKGETFAVIIQTLSELGYDVQWLVLNSKFFGVPQNRERVFIIGSLRGTSRTEVFPIFGTTGEVVKKDGVIMLDVYNKGMRDECPTLTEPHHNSIRLLKNSKIRKLTPVECERLQGFPDGWTEGVSDTQRYKQLGNAVTVNVIEAIIKQIKRGN